MTTNLKTQNENSTKPVVYRPRASNGWLWVGAFGLLMFSIVAILVWTLASSGYGFGAAILPAVIIGGLGLVFLMLAVWFPTMRYIISGDILVLRYGPINLYRIDLKQVQKIRQCDLGYSMLSSLRFPGLAVHSVHYPEVGMVNMCATSAFHSILLIETATAKYGVTPAEPEKFVADLRSRIGA